MSIRKEPKSALTSKEIEVLIDQRLREFEQAAESKVIYNKEEKPKYKFRRFISKLFKLSYASILMSSMVACNFSNKNSHSAHTDFCKVDSTIFQLRDIDKLKQKEDSFINIGDKKNELVSKLAIGRRYREISRFDSALQYHQNAFDLAIQLNDSLEMMNSSLQLGTNFRRIGNNEEASKYLYNGMNIYDNYSEKKNENVNRIMVSILNGLGNVEQEMGNSRESLNLFFRSLHEVLNNTPLNRAINYSNIGDTYSRMAMIDSAKYYYRLSLQANFEAKVPTGIGLGYINSGNIFKRANQIDSAAIFYNKAYDILETTKDRWHWLISCNALADLYLVSNKLDKAKYYINEGLEEIKTLNSLRGARDVYYYTSVFYEKSGNYKDALYYTRLANDMSDKLKNEKSSDNINNLRLAYERERAKHKTELLVEQNRSQQKSITIIVLLGLALLFFIVTAFSLYLLHTRRKGLKQLQKAYLDLQTMHKRAERAEQMKSAFIQSITHEIRTPLNAIQGFGGLLVSGNYDDVAKAEFYKEIEKGVLNLTEQVNNMLDLSNYTTGQIKINKEEIYVQDILKGVAQEINSKIPESVSLKINVPVDNIKVKTDLLRLSQVLHNLLSNSCKNTTKGDIILGAMMHDNKIRFYVEDTGCGIPNDMAESIFSGFVKVDTFKQGIGIGLRLSMLICDALDAQLSYDKEYTAGARFYVDIDM